MFALGKFAATVATVQTLKREIEKLTSNLLKHRTAFNVNKVSSIRYKSRQQKDDENLNLVKLTSQAHMIPFESENTTPIIIMHGILGSKSNWNSMAKAIMKGTNNRLVFCLDARNHGDSGHTEAFSYELMVADLIKFLYDHNIKKASFIGHSMGGRVCMLLAQINPLVIQDLVVVDISPVGDSPQMLALPKIFDAIQGLKVDPFILVNDARKIAFKQLNETLQDEKLVRFLLTNMVETVTGSWRWKFNIESISQNFHSEICKFPKLIHVCNRPLLFIAGENSDYIRPGDEPSIRHIFPNSKFIYVSGAGHWVHADQPKLFLAAVIDFLNRNHYNQEW